MSIDYVMVGNPGNEADPVSGYGAVSYTYNISKYETTISQYAEFLNAKAKNDSTGLYSSYMGSDLRIVGIQRIFR